MLINQMRVSITILVMCSVTIIPISASEKRRMITSNIQSCSEIDDRNYNSDLENCIPFYDKTYWTEEFLYKLCHSGGNTDKGITAALCPDYANNENYVISLKLSILNKMYGTNLIDPNSCGYNCMYDPLNLVGIFAVGYKWSNILGCWQVLTGATDSVCYLSARGKNEWENVMKKSYNWCPGRICEAYGNPHTYSFYGNKMDMENGIGDYVLYRSDTLRIDVRLRAFVSDEGILWNGVSGIYATAMEVIDGDCKVKIEIYNKHQTGNGKVMLMFNEEKVGWKDLPNRFSTCDEICQNRFEIDNANEQVTVTFADQVVVRIKRVENMQAIWILAPLDAFTGETLQTDDQICMEQYQKLDCHNYGTIFTYHDYDPELAGFMDCDDTIDLPIFPAVDCNLSFKTLAEEVCSECAVCPHNKLVESCEFEICFALGAIDEWNYSKMEEAWTVAKKIAKKYCDWTAEFSDLYPWKCIIDATEQPDFPSAPGRRIGNTVVPTVSPTYAECLYLNTADVEDTAASWTGEYRRINDPVFKNGKAHYSGPIGNELYWMEEGVYGQRWILAVTEGFVLAATGRRDNKDVPNYDIWQVINITDCEPNCVEIGGYVNISVTMSWRCIPTSVPTMMPSKPPTAIPSEDSIATLSEDSTAFPVEIIAIIVSVLICIIMALVITRRYRQPENLPNDFQKTVELGYEDNTMQEI